MGGRRSSNGCSPTLAVLSYLVLLMQATRCTHEADSIRQGGSLKDGETLVSQGEAFELGFFTPGGSSSRYVGIWYKNVSVKTVVWVANRQSGLTDISGELSLNDEGNLLILNGIGSPFIIASSPAASSPVARLLDTGNLVLVDGANGSRVLWQSFDYPTDTLLPGMRLGFKGKQNRMLTSWRSADDPSAGDFQFSMDPNGTDQLLILQRGHSAYWTSGLWDGQGFSLVPELSLEPTNIFQLNFVSNMNEKYFLYFIRNTNITSRFVMDSRGQIRYLFWAGNLQGWILLWSQPRSDCDVFSYCGANSVCDERRPPPCECLQGFEPDSFTEWQAGNWGRGCVRRNESDCGKSDMFLPLNVTRLPTSKSSFFNYPLSGTADCNTLCIKNCSCTAYAPAGEEGRGCILLFGDLLNAQRGDDQAKEVYVRLASSDFRASSNVAEVRATSRSKKLLPVLLPAVASLVLFLILFVSTCYWRRWNSRDQGEEANNQELLLLEIGPEGGEKFQDFSLLSFTDVVAATGNFSSENKLGEGGFGPVHKGVFPDGQEIAVKRLSRRSTQGLEEFKTEILLIAKLQHRNLVRLLGCCIKGEERMLIYEYLPNKSLDFFLFDPQRAAELDWGKRFHIIEGIAQGLLYLHKHSRLRIIHRDLKASNVLLDSEMNPKISDFGLARIFRRNDSEANTNRVVGTYGYMAPEYAMEGLFSVKSDVFSFGVLLLEIVTGKRNTATGHFNSSLNLLGHAWKLWREGRALELVDPSIGDSFPEEEVSRCIHVALMCVQDAAADRPVTSDVVAMLGAENASLPAPKQPAFFIGRNVVEEDSNPRLPANCSINIVTVSAVDGR